MRLFVRLTLALGLGFLAIGLLRTSEDSWIYAHVAGQVFLGVLGVVFFASCAWTPRGRR